MKLSVAQIKGKIKSLANKTNSDARILLRIYMMDRFLERLACSNYKDNFIIKGGILVTSMVGVELRSTMDIDATVKNISLSEEDTLRVVKEIADISVDDDISFEVTKVSKIMDSFEYPGIRVEINAVIGEMLTPIKLDISAGDIITPQEIEYSYNLLIEDKKINLRAYNLETVIAEKLHTILARDILNTRMRDFYDVYILTKYYEKKLDEQILIEAFNATCKRRNSVFVDIDSQIKRISESDILQELWKKYQDKYIYATEISFKNVVESIKSLVEKLG